MTEQLPATVQVEAVLDLDAAKAQLAQLKQFVDFYLQEGEDFGIIPGCPKPSLYKSGANKLCEIYGLKPIFETVEVVQDWDRTIQGQAAPLFMYRVLCHIVRKADELEMGQAFGTCNSYEGKYLWRKADKACPECGSLAIMRSKTEWGGGYYCNPKKGGCGGSWKALVTERHCPNDDELAIVAQIDAQPVGRMVNDDLFAQDNTVLQMAQKRALVAATISATRSSQLFTMDLEDIQPVPPREPVPVLASAEAREQFLSDAKGLGWGKKEAVKYLCQDRAVNPRKLEETVTVDMLAKAMVHFRNNPVAEPGKHADGVQAPSGPTSAHVPATVGVDDEVVDVDFTNEFKG
jgi:predicted RNA-binding Zn-ribbon protein involved in translation (DUF1610 family)